MHGDITKQLEKKLTDKVAKEINLDLLAKKLAPVIEKELFKSFIEGVKNCEWRDCLHDSLGDKFCEALEDSLIRALNKLK